MTPQELKNSILQLAIQGKLVEQRPEEGTGEELYKRIQAEKQELIEDGKLKNEKTLPEITEDEVPFEIPESWKWVRFGDVSSYAQRKEKVSAINISADMWSLDLEDIEKDTGKITNHCLACDRTISGDKVKFKTGNILYSKLRPYLKKVLVAPADGICSSEIVPFVMYGNIEPEYARYFLISPFADGIVNSASYGVKMPRVSTDTMTSLCFPLPPLAEQKRIVAKIEELLPLVERYGEAWTKLEEFNKKFPDDMKKSILQQAIQGKLVEQRPEEGTGEELYQRIQAEKQKFIKDGKLKKEKPLPEITEDEIPFEIPESWKWVHLSDLGEIVGGGTPKTGDPSLWDDDGIPWLTPADMKNIRGMYASHGERNISQTGLAKSSAQLMPKGTVLYSSRAPIGYIAIAANDICTNQGFKSLVPANTEINKYMYYCLIARTDDIKARASGTTFKEISGAGFGATLVPLPPLGEQKRIVAKIEEILPLCEKLK